MKQTTKILFAIACMILCIALNGCGKYQTMETSEVEKYLCKRYGGDFEVVSTEEKARCDRDYLDKDMEKLNTKGDDRNEDPDYIYQVRDEYGVEFHVVGFKQYGWGSYYNYTDDYSVQVLKTKDVLYEKLEALGYPYTYYNGIGYDDIPKAVFDVEIENFDDVEDVVTVSVKGDEYTCMHNGEEYQVEGIWNHLLKLTEKDMQELFGITYGIDMIEETAEIVCKY